MDTETESNELKTSYFYRFIVPLVITMIILFGAAAIIYTPPGTPLSSDLWKTFSTAQPRLGGGGGRR